MNKKHSYFRNTDYTVRKTVIDGNVRFFMKFHGVEETPELEISHEMFALYAGDFYKPLDNQRKERSRHIANSEMDNFIKPGKRMVYTTDDENMAVDIYTIEAILKTCTPNQQKRFALHYINGFSFTEIAKMEHCHESSVRESIKAVTKKIKNIF